MNGKKGSVLVPSEQADALRLAYQMYAEPSTLLHDILTYFKEHEDEIRYLRTDEYGGKNGSHSGKSRSPISKKKLPIRKSRASRAIF